MKIINYLGRALLKTIRITLVILMVMMCLMYFALVLVELFVWQWPVFFAIVFLAVLQQILMAVYDCISETQDRFTT